MTGIVDAGAVLTREQIVELRAVVNSRDVAAVVATRARIVLWRAAGDHSWETGERTAGRLVLTHLDGERCGPTASPSLGWPMTTVILIGDDSVQTFVATKQAEGWQIAAFQNTCKQNPDGT